MNIAEILSLTQTELKHLARSGFLSHLAIGHLAVMAVTVLLAWPAAVIPGATAPALTWNWFNYVMLGTLTYVALALASEMIPIPGRVPSFEWVYYGVARPLNVLVARTLSTLLLLLILAALSAPIGVLAHAAVAVPPARVLGAAAVTATLSLCALAAGLYIGTGVADPAMRAVAANSLYIAGLALALVVGGWIGPLAERGIALLNPLGAMHHFLNPQAAETSSHFPWTGWTVLYGLVVVTLFALAHARLWEWLPGRGPASRKRVPKVSDPPSEKEWDEAAPPSRGEPR